MKTKNRRRGLRLSSEDDEMITEAAGLLGVSVSEFFLSRAVPDAEAIVDAHRMIRLQEGAYARFLVALDAPAEPVAELVAQIQKSRTLDHGR